VPGAASVLSTGGALRTLAGVDPAVGGPFLATRAGTAVTVVRREDLAPIATFDIRGADKLAVSERWLVARVRGRDGGDVLQARALAGTGQVRGIAAVPAPAQLGRPALDGDLLVYHVAGRRSGRIVLVNLATGRRRTAREAAGAQLTNPSLLDRRLLYVRATPRSQTLMLGTLGRPAGDRVLYRIAALARRDAGHDPGKRPHRRHYRDPDPPPRDRTGAAATLWSTALTARAAYVTRVRALGGHTTASLLRVRR